MPGMIEYKCPCCGGVVEFDAASQQMKCPYCDTVFDVEALKSKDDVLAEAKEDEMVWAAPSTQWASGETDAMGVYTCKSCGGEIVADDNTGATQCPFCGNPVMLTARFAGGLKPDYVIPFKLTKEDAKKELKKFMSGKKLLPKLFSSENHLEEIKGVYVPFWLYDANANVNISYKATQVNSWRQGKYEYTETKYFDVFRAGNIGFENIPVDGSSKMPDELMESIEPFDFREAKDFQTAYLSGYLADKYDVTAEENVARANERAKTTAEQACSSTVKGYTSVTAERSSVQIANGKAKYALYPVWLLTTNYKNEKYQFAMNGQTGKFVGKMPMDKGAYRKWYLIYAAIAAAVSWGALFLLSSIL